MTIQKPFSQACENNKAPILAILKEVFRAPQTVFEIGSGTGQHACYFAGQMPHLQWQPSDRAENIAGIRTWVEDAGLPNLKLPLALDVNDRDWPCRCIEAVFTANTLHMMSRDEVATLFDKLADVLNADASVCIYGPFNYAGHYTSDSNARFDDWLKARDPLSGIKHFEDVAALAEEIGLILQADHAMPANNRLLVFKRRIDPANSVT
ncbi:DUF938 domain-containing protein [Methylomonas sp. MgM2]